MKESYCIYTDRVIPKEQVSREHIIPLSLGGSNEFVIEVSSSRNSELGSQIDGNLANDLAMQFLRKHHKTRGHSNRKAIVSLRRSRLVPSNMPVQVQFKEGRVEVYDPINRKYLDKEQCELITFEAKYWFDRFIRIKFTAKVLLAAGYFAYGELFRKEADHSALRELMADGPRTKADEGMPRLRLYDPLSPVQEKHQGFASVLELICNHVRSSCVIFVLGEENIVGTVGILGEFVGTINLRANTRAFPNAQEHRLGNVIYFKDGKIVRESFYDTVTKMGHTLGCLS